MGYITDIWGVSILFWGIGLFFWFATYIGAPLESKKRGKHVSGVPGMAFICFLLAGLAAPIKWLTLICLADISITMLPFFLIREHIKNKNNKRNDS